MAKSRISIIGLGLIGGSIGLALKKANLEVEIIGHDKDPGVSAKAQKRGAVDATKWNLIDACEGAGLIILALPLDGIAGTLDALKPHLAPGTIITDTATSKVSVLDAATRLPAGAQFIGGNPVLKPNRAKTERGIDAADADLFQEATWCLVAAPSATGEAIDTVANFAGLLGAKAYFMDAAEHDGLMTGVQHLPMLLATAFGAATMTSAGWRELGKVASGDFRAATEIVPDDPKTAREQLFAHRDDVLRWLDVMNDQLHTLRQMIEREDAAALEALVKTVSTERAKWQSGSLDQSQTNVNWEDTKYSPARFFLGGLADAGKKRK
ncbi:MAG: prephenate dehydrogenase/arogenate dehydrogenase family protein [Chloroflexi bacterium]|nr:prephenate dehydrogenase/arogenate dehydrogenase family protein [Chloroflexota bacterium]